MAAAKDGDRVRVHYRGFFDDGNVFDDTSGKEPFEFTIGEEQVIPGFERAVVGMNAGESKTVKLTPEEAYGESLKELIQEVPKSKVPSDVDPKPGMIFQITGKSGQSANVTVSDVSETSVTIDGNHPLAGKTLNFELTLIEIVK